MAEPRQSHTAAHVPEPPSLVEASQAWKAAPLRPVSSSQPPGVWVRPNTAMGADCCTTAPVQQTDLAYDSMVSLFSFCGTRLKGITLHQSPDVNDVLEAHSKCKLLHWHLAIGIDRDTHLSQARWDCCSSEVPRQQM